MDRRESYPSWRTSLCSYLLTGVLRIMLSMRKLIQSSMNAEARWGDGMMGDSRWDEWRLEDETEGEYVGYEEDVEEKLVVL